MKIPRFKRPNRKFDVATLGTLVAFVAVVALFRSSGASAVQPNCSNGPYIDYGRYEWCGYFDNNFQNSGLRLWNNGVPASVGATGNAQAKVQEFITFIENERTGTVDGIQGRTAAEFVIDTMEGLVPPNNGRGQAWILQSDWENRLKNGLADNVIKINYFQQVNWHCGQEDTYYQGPSGGGGLNDVAFYHTIPGGEIPNCGPNVTVPAIVITNAKTGAVIYEIKRICGNPFGTINALPTVNFDVTLTADRHGSPAQVIAGQSYSLGVGLQNNGPDDSEVGNLQVQLPANITQPCAPNCNPATEAALTFGDDSSKGFETGSSIPAVAGHNWFWVTKQLANNATTTGFLNFTVAPNAPVGTVITFDVYYYPANAALATKHVTVTYTVISERTPSVVGVNGDVHAGGGLCGGAQSAPAAGYVEGDAGAVSGTQYVVSATAGVGNFASNNLSATQNNLTVGSNGAYADVCRENLLAVAQAYYNAGVGYATISGTQNVGTLNPMASVFFSTGGTLKLTGTLTRKMTIVALNGGNIEISGDIQIGGPATLAQNTPSLGLIASGNISIDSAVTRVDAYLFADGAIDTCTQFAQVPNPCTSNLTVNGFLMGQSIAFHRIGPFNTDGAPIAENIVLNPQIYLNPPMFFDASVDNTTLEGQGELQPLF